MANLQDTFEFVGELKFGKEPTKETVFDSGWAKKEASVAINESKSNGVFLSVEGMYNSKSPSSSKVFSFSKGIFGEKGGKLEVSWEDRKNKDIIRTVADFSKVIIDLTTDEEAKKKFYDLRGEIFKIEQKEEPEQEDRDKLQELYKLIEENVPHRYEFLHGYDVVDFFENMHEKLSGKKFRVKGNVEVSHWKGKFYINYKPNLFEIVSEDIPNKLTADLDLYFTKDVADKALLKSDNVITYNTHVYAYDSAHRKKVFFPLETVMNLSNYDLEDNKAHKAHYNIIEKYMTVKGKGVYRLPYSVKIVRGSEIVGFSEKDLTEDQQSLIDIGYATMDDFKPKGLSFGESLNEVRLMFPMIKDLGNDMNFTEGAIKTDWEEDDLDYVAIDRGTKTSDVKDKVEDKSEEVDFGFDPSDLPF